MKFLCDVHIPIRISKRLEDLGYPTTHANRILQKWNTPDEDLARFADENNCILISKDQDFKQSYLVNQTPKRLLKVNTGNLPNQALLEKIESCLSQLNQIYQSHQHFLVELNADSIWFITD
ncbi:MAG: DUF5615 family PIN-like protein [Bacteroidota bacterium]